MAFLFSSNTTFCQLEFTITQKNTSTLIEFLLHHKNHNFILKNHCIS